MFTGSAVWLAGEWLVRLGMLPVVVLRKQRPVTCLAWLTVIFFQPWVGLAAYGLIGENRLGTRRIREHAKYADRLLDTVRRPGPMQEHVVCPNLGPERQPMVYVAQRLGGMPILSGNAIEFLDDTDEVIEHLIRDIDAARDHVHLLYYIFAADHTGCRVTDALVRATKRGVRCRLLADAVGSRRMLRKSRAELIRQGVEVVPALSANILRRGLARLDLRNHRKIAVIDGRIGYAGSHNIIRPDYGKRGVGAWQDLTARITGPSVGHLQAVFVEDWNFEMEREPEATELYPPPSVDGPVAIQSVPSGPNYPTAVVQDVLVEALHAARREVIMTTPYFIPDEALLVAMRLAVVRGVRVVLIVPAHSDHRLVDFASRFYYEQLLRLGVHVHLHQRGLLHAKTMTADDRFGFLGSANFDIRSFYLNFEFNLLLYDPDTTAKLRSCQDGYLQESHELDPGSCRASATERLTQNCAKLLSPLL